MVRTHYNREFEGNIGASQSGNSRENREYILWNREFGLSGLSYLYRKLYNKISDIHWEIPFGWGYIYIYSGPTWSVSLRQNHHSNYGYNWTQICAEDMNPPNVAQPRPIGTYWVYLKRKVYHNGWASDNTEQMTNLIRQMIRNTPENFAQNWMR